MKQFAKDSFHISLMPRNSINCYIVEGYLVDSGIRSSFKKISAAFKKVPAHTHILTHAHSDHQGSTQKICEIHKIPLLCHKLEVWRTETGFVTYEYPNRKNILGKFQQRYWAGNGCKVDHTLKENDFVGNFRVIETPGHSSGHISLFREQDGVLIIGDAATNMDLLTSCTGLNLPPSIFTTDQRRNLDSLRKLAALNPKIICFGHGPILYNNGKQFEKFVENVSRYQS